MYAVTTDPDYAEGFDLNVAQQSNAEEAPEHSLKEFGAPERILHLVRLSEKNNF